MFKSILGRIRPVTFLTIPVMLAALGLYPAVGESWPSGTIRIISPFSAGSSADTISRIVMNEVSTQVGQPVVVLNRVGSGGTIGNLMVVQSAPDGLTVLSTGALAAAAALYEDLPYSTLNDLVPVAALGLQPFVLVTSPSRGFKTLADLVAAGKRKPGSITYASGGIGSATHFAAERLRVSAGFEALHVPYRGAQDGLTEVLAGRLDFMFLPAAGAYPLILNKQILPLAVSSSKRSALIPDVPTTEELGLRNSAYDWWADLFLPAKTPRDVLTKFHAEVEKALQVPAVQKSLAHLGVEPMSMNLEETAKYFEKDVNAYVQLVKDARIPVQKK